MVPGPARPASAPLVGWHHLDPIRAPSPVGDRVARATRARSSRPAGATGVGHLGLTPHRFHRPPLRTPRSGGRFVCTLFCRHNGGHGYRRNIRSDRGQLRLVPRKSAQMPTCFLVPSWPESRQISRKLAELRPIFPADGRESPGMRTPSRPQIGGLLNPDTPQIRRNSRVRRVRFSVPHFMGVRQRRRWGSVTS
jgi:hypothetical protein